jgi:hypothetical protein
MSCSLPLQPGEAERQALPVQPEVDGGRVVDVEQHRQVRRRQRISNPRARSTCSI